MSLRALSLSLTVPYFLCPKRDRRDSDRYARTGNQFDCYAQEANFGVKFGQKGQKSGPEMTLSMLNFPSKAFFSAGSSLPHTIPAQSDGGVTIP